MMMWMIVAVIPKKSGSFYATFQSSTGGDLVLRNPGEKNKAVTSSSVISGHVTSVV